MLIRLYIEIRLFRFPIDGEISPSRFKLDRFLKFIKAALNIFHANLQRKCENSDLIRNKKLDKNNMSLQGNNIEGYIVADHSSP